MLTRTIRAALFSAIAASSLWGAGPVLAAQEGPGRLSAAQKADIEAVSEPVLLGPRRGGVILLPDGALKSFYAETGEGGLYKNYSVTSPDGGVTWASRVSSMRGRAHFYPSSTGMGNFISFP